jgi:hypothetical protein
MREQLQQGRESYKRRAWNDAYRALMSADQAAPLDIDDLERLATSAYLTGRDLEFQRFLERLHRAHVEADDRDRAARSAFWLALSLLFRGDVGQSNAWIARGERLVEDRDCVERGYLLLPVAEEQLREGKADAAYATAAHVVAMGVHFGDAELTAIARHVQGRALIEQSQVQAGLRLLDETMLAVIAGELSPTDGADVLQRDRSVPAKCMGRACE